MKKLDESIYKLSKYSEALNSKKQQRSELMNERTGSNLKMGSQLHRNTSDLSAHRLEDRAKNASLNKRFRSTVTEHRVSCKYNNRESIIIVLHSSLILIFFCIKWLKMQFCNFFRHQLACFT